MSSLLHTQADIAFIFDQAHAGTWCQNMARVPGSAAPGGSSPHVALPAQGSGVTAGPVILVRGAGVLLSNVLRRDSLRAAAQCCSIPVGSERIGKDWSRNAARIWDVHTENVSAQWTAVQEAFAQADQGGVSR